MNPIRNPFSRDEHPDLTAAILGVVNETHSRKTLEGLSTTALRKLRKEYQAGVAKGHKDAARELADIHGILRSRGAGAALDEDYQTPSREREMLRKMKAAERGSDAASKQYIRAWDAEYKTPERNPKAVEASRVAGKKLAAASRKRDRLYATQRKEEMSRRLYGSRGKVLKRKVQEAAQLDERIIDEVDFFQASKNWITGKGFKTNREVIYDRVNKNYAAMKKREAAAAKAKKTK